MFLGVFPVNDDCSKHEPVYLPEHTVVYVGKGIFDALVEKGYPLWSGNAEQTDSDVLLMNDATGQLPDKSGQSVYVLATWLPPHKYMECGAKVSASFPGEQTANDSFSSDLVGAGATPLISIREKKYEVPAKPEEKIENVQTRSSIWTSVKKDGLNPLTAIMFLLLGLATNLGYFFLGEGTGPMFRVICIIMAAAFSFMVCIPIGFLYSDRHCNKPTDSTFFVLSATLVASIAFLCPMICLALGNQHGWQKEDVTIFGWLGLSSLLWCALRIAFDKSIKRLFSKKA